MNETLHWDFLTEALHKGKACGFEKDRATDHKSRWRCQEKKKEEKTDVKGFYPFELFSELYECL